MLNYIGFCKPKKIKIINNFKIKLIKNKNFIRILKTRYIFGFFGIYEKKKI